MITPHCFSKVHSSLDAINFYHVYSIAMLQHMSYYFSAHIYTYCYCYTNLCDRH